MQLLYLFLMQKESPCAHAIGILTPVSALQESWR